MRALGGGLGVTVWAHRATGGLPVRTDRRRNVGGAGPARQLWSPAQAVAVRCVVTVPLILWAAGPIQVRVTLCRAQNMPACVPQAVSLKTFVYNKDNICHEIQERPSK